MNYRTVSTKYLKTTTEQELKVEVYYSKGGANYLAGGIIQRGYWLSVQPVSRSVSKWTPKRIIHLGQWVEILSERNPGRPARGENGTGSRQIGGGS